MNLLSPTCSVWLPRRFLCSVISRIESYSIIPQWSIKLLVFLRNLSIFLIWQKTKCKSFLFWIGSNFVFGQILSDVMRQKKTNKNYCKWIGNWQICKLTHKKFIYHFHWLNNNNNNNNNNIWLDSQILYLLETQKH